MSLVPFGWSEELAKLLDIAEVSKGKNCGCICPSCKVKLIARQGDVNEWHFAHDSKFKENEDYIDCDFSYYVSLRMMIRQILTEIEYIYVPIYQKYYDSLQKYISITGDSKVEYSEVLIDSSDVSTSQLFDAKLHVGGKNLHLFVSYPSRPFLHPCDTENYFGILEIDIGRFEQDASNGDSCKEQLRKLLQNDHPSKLWRFHKREKRFEKELIDNINSHIKNAGSSDCKDRSGMISAKSFPETSVPQMWHCVICDIQYLGWKDGKNPCPRCDSHLYRKVVQKVNENKSE